MTDSRPTFVTQWNDGTILGSPEFWDPGDTHVLLVDGVFCEDDLIAVPLGMQLPGVTHRECAFQVGERTYQARTIYGEHYGQPVERTIVIGDKLYGGYDALDIRGFRISEGKGLVGIFDVRGFKNGIPKMFGPGKLVTSFSNRGIRGIYKPYKASHMKPLSARIMNPKNATIRLNSDEECPNVVDTYFANIGWLRNALTHSKDDTTALELYYRQFQKAEKVG